MYATVEMNPGVAILPIDSDARVILLGNLALDKGRMKCPNCESSTTARPREKAMPPLAACVEDSQQLADKLQELGINPDEL